MYISVHVKQTWIDVRFNSISKILKEEAVALLKFRLG